MFHVFDREREFHLEPCIQSTLIDPHHYVISMVQTLASYYLRLLQEIAKMR